MDDALLFYITAASGLTKGLVDLIRALLPDKPLLPPALAVPIGILFVFVFALYQAETLTPQLYAMSVLAGTFAGLGAVGISALNDWSERRRDFAKAQGAENDSVESAR